MKLSIVTTLYHSAPYILEFHARCTASAQKLVGDDYEIVMVNDGSPDNSLDVAVGLTEKDPHVVVVDLSRNFGHHKAMMTGLEHARGELVFLIDSDLEEEPEWLGLFHKKMCQENLEVVFGVQRTRKGGLQEKLYGTLFYKALNAMSRTTVAPNSTVGRLMNRCYVDALLEYKERDLFIGGIMAYAGFRQGSCEVVKHSTSPTTYTILHKLGLAVTSLVSFSSRPLQWIFCVGLFITFVSILSLLYFVISFFVFEKEATGWLSLVASIWLIGGILITFMGVTGLYISTIFDEVKQRPNAIVRSVIKTGQ